MAAGVAVAAEYDQFGGWRQLSGTKTGFFHTQQIDGRWWLITPEGYAFFSKGVDNVNYRPEAASSPKPPADPNAWASAAVRQLRGWNFNTAGAWSVSEVYDKGLVYAPVINMAAAVQRDVWLKGGVVDYFGQEFRNAAERVAQRQCAPHARDPWLLGYFTDNELRWGRDWRSEDSLLEAYLKMPAESAGLRKAKEFVKQRGHAAESLTDDDKSEFLGVVAAEYARVTSEAIRRADPNHMVLGCRFAVYPGDTAMRAAGKYFDVISFHSYNADAPIERLNQIHRLTGKPTMVTEFSFKAMDSGLPNTKGAAKPVATQQDRADGFARYVDDLAALPHCVGFHWFEYRDEPKEGRFDGENSNYGLVKIDFTPWDVLTARMTRVNAQLEARHAAADGAIDLLPPDDFKSWTRIPIPPVDGLKPKIQWRVDAAQHALVCTGDGGHEWLRSDREFGDFVLDADWRFTPRASDEKRYNSGIGVRLSKYGEIWYQAQTGLSGAYLFGNNMVDGILQSFNLSKQMKENRVKAAGEWNHYEVTARGGTITLSVNGAVVSELANCGLRRGSVGFEAEGYEITFKNLKLKVLE